MLKNRRKLYVGITQNVEQRLKDHNSYRGALFTKDIDRFQVVFIEEQESLAIARKREVQIKKWRRDKKETLIERYQNSLATKTPATTRG